MANKSTADRIADVALTILTEEGPDAVTMRRVATTVGLTPMATYKHFPNRETLLRTVAESGFVDVAKDWGKRATATDFASRLDGLLDDFLDFALGKPHLYAFLLTEQRPGARRFPDDFRAGASPAFAPVTEVVEQGMREGELRDDDALEVTLVITAQAMGLVQRYTAGRMELSEQDFRALCKRSVERLLNGLRT